MVNEKGLFYLIESAWGKFMSPETCLHTHVRVAWLADA